MTVSHPWRNGDGRLRKMDPYPSPVEKQTTKEVDPYQRIGYRIGISGGIGVPPSGMLMQF